MVFSKLSRQLCVLALSSGLLVTVGIDDAAAFTISELSAGAEAHPAVLARHGGVYPDETLTDYVTSVGRRLAAQAREPVDEWTFTVLDTPNITAFGQPGGYIYVSRGLLAYSDSEAELAAVMAHQMAHVMENHITLRPGPGPAPDRGLAEGALLDGLIGGRPEGEAPRPFAGRVTGEVPTLSAEAEVEAVKQAVALLAAAGYPADAAGAIVERLVARSVAEPSLAGGAVHVFGKSPGVREAVLAEITETAARIAPVEEVDARREMFLAAIEGLVYGESPNQGLVRDGGFVHPVLRFAFDVPDGFAIAQSAAEVIARGPNGATMVLDTTEDAGPRLQSYIRDSWAPSLTRQVEAGYLYDLQSVEVGPFEGASAFQPYEDGAGAKVAQLVVIRTDRRVYRFRAIAPAEDIDASLAMEEAIRTFREVGQAEAARYRPYWLQVHEVGRGETLNLLTATMPLRDNPELRFRLLNGYHDGRLPLVGDLVKLVLE